MLRTLLVLAVCSLAITGLDDSFAWASGTRATFTALWTPGELVSRSSERQSGHRVQPDRSGPDATGAPARPPLPENLRGSIRRVNTHGAKLVALTFDLCELADQVSGYDGAVIDALRSAGAKATFFAGGKWMRSHPERAMQLMSDPLFEVGSHAWTHGNFGRLSSEAMHREIAWTQAQYAALRQALIKRTRERGLPDTALTDMPTAPTLFRFPYGRCNAPALQQIAETGLAAIQWSLSTGDPDPASTPQRIVKNVLANVRPGDIIIGHANGNGHGTAQALPELLTGLRAKGYTLVTVGELLAAGTPVRASDCYDSHPGDTARYDAIFGDGTVHPTKKSGTQPTPRSAPTPQ